jgi:DNA-binding CsgD family transcriptional regulator
VRIAPKTQGEGSTLSSQPHKLEVRILASLAAGRNYVEIATAEYLSSRTVRRMVRQLKQQTGATSLPGLCAEATRRGWLSVDEAAPRP